MASIVFQYVQYQNFLSVGNDPITINLADHPTVLVSGPNGSGKCLRGTTKIHVEFGDDETQKKFEAFMNKFMNKRK